MTQRLAAIVAAVLSVLLGTASPASAGQYTVHGPCGNWTPYNSAPNRLAVYVACPAMVVRNTYGGFSTPEGAQGGWVFDAPSGTGIVSVALNGEAFGFKGWQAAGWASDQLPYLNCPGYLCPGARQSLQTYPAFGAQHFILRVRCGASSCSNNGAYGSIAVSDVAVTLDDSVPPAVGIAGGSAVTGGWKRGVQDVVIAAADNTGIRDTSAYIDGLAKAQSSGHACSYWQKIPCPQGGDTLPVSTIGLPDGRHTLTVQATDAGGGAASASTTILTDNTPPAQPVQAGQTGDGAWRATNQFSLRWVNPPQTAAPIAGVTVQLCPATTPSASSVGCVSSNRMARDVTSIPELSLPGPGAWAARLWLIDDAGNASPANAAVVPSLRFDPTPPDAALLPRDPADPARIRVRATDSISGVTRGEIEIQREGSNEWLAQPVEIGPDGFSTRVDDEHLRDGTYRVRARAFDAAGNERTTETLADGSPALVNMPARINTRLAVGRPARTTGSRPRARLDRAPRVPFGRSVLLRGRLTTPGVNPVAGAHLEVWRRVALQDATWTRIGEVMTSPSGRFSFRAPPGPSRLIRFRFPGTATIRAREAVVSLLVSASTSFTVDRRAVVNGDDVTFRGQLRGRPLPPGGKLIELQVYTRRRWRTFALPRARAEDGRWSYRYRFETIRGHARFRFRARVRTEAAYPYTLGTSRQLHVDVRGV